MKAGLCGKVMTGFYALRPKAYSCLTNDNDENKKQKSIKKCIIKQKPNFEYYEHVLQTTQLENEVKYQEKNKLDMNSLRENHKEFIKNKKIIK